MLRSLTSSFTTPSPALSAEPTARALATDAVQKANSGHAGMPSGMAEAAYVLWSRFLRHNPANPRWPSRDRFVISAGHGSMLLYSHCTYLDMIFP